MVTDKFHTIRWNWVIASTCLGLLAWFRADDGRLVGAILVAAAAIGAACMALTSRRLTQPQTTTHRQETTPYPDPDRVERTLHWYRTRRGVWLTIAAAGWVAAILGVFLFPPLSLVAAAVAACAVVRYRRVHAHTRTLAAILPKLHERYGDGAAVQADH